MISLMFALPEHHASWLTSHWHDVGMTSSGSHHVHIACVTASCLHHDGIAFMHESQLQSWHMTDRFNHENMFNQ